jgi:hypothetical protein
MHETNISFIKSFIDNYYFKDNETTLYGWILSTDDKYAPIIKIIINEGEEIYPTHMVERKDVVEFYSNPIYNICGWYFNITKKVENIDFYVSNNYDNWQLLNITNSYKTDNKILFRNLDTNANNNAINIINNYNNNNTVDNFSINKNTIPSFIVVDNVYQNPDYVRDFALKQEFIEHKLYHKGKRTDSVYRFPGLKELFESKIGVKIKNWEKYGTNGCFQICIAGDQLVYHYDGQEYAGVLFLTPDAPPQTGTSFYRSKYTKKMKMGENEYDIVFRNGHLDSTDFDLVDTVGNVYNRIVLFDAKLIHSASCYFGTNKDNCRLFQIFFFDLETNL